MPGLLISAAARDQSQGQGMPCPCIIRVIILPNGRRYAALGWW
ncbi:MAG: hypothetical protein V2I46_02270 [Bacteroides sp.]|nr:hypothetical protein [Bacteroides sp.]